MVVGAHTRTHANTHTHRHTNVQAHAYTHLHTFPCLLRLTNMHLFSKSSTRSFPHFSSCHPSFHSSNSLTRPHPFSSETNKCVTCQQSTIGPYDLCRSLYPFVHSAVFLSSPSCFPFLCRLSTHFLVQSVFPTLVLSLYGPVVIPYLTLSSWSRTGDMKALWFLWLLYKKAFEEPRTLAALQVSCQYFCLMKGSRPGP